MSLLVHMLDGEIMRMSEAFGNATAGMLGSKFPFGDVYVRYKEPQGLQWRVLQRSTRQSDVMTYFDALLPIKVEQLPEIVQVVHACTN
jgi:hypothetical protein